MSQSFKIVNKTKKQVIEPSLMGSGWNHYEILWNTDRGSALQGLGHLISTCEEETYRYREGVKPYKLKGSWVGDVVIMVGEYDNSELYHKSNNARWYTDITKQLMHELYFYPDGDLTHIGRKMSEYLKKHGTGSIFESRKNILKEFFPLDCHEGDLRREWFGDGGPSIDYMKEWEKWYDYEKLGNLEDFEVAEKWRKHCTTLKSL